MVVRVTLPDRRFAQSWILDAVPKGLCSISENSAIVIQNIDILMLYSSGISKTGAVPSSEALQQALDKAGVSGVCGPCNFVLASKDRILWTAEARGNGIDNTIVLVWTDHSGSILMTKQLLTQGRLRVHKTSSCTSSWAIVPGTVNDLLLNIDDAVEIPRGGRPIFAGKSATIVFKDSARKYDSVSSEYVEISKETLAFYTDLIDKNICFLSERDFVVSVMAEVHEVQELKIISALHTQYSSHDRMTMYMIDRKGKRVGIARSPSFDIEYRSVKGEPIYFDEDLLVVVNESGAVVCNDDIVVELPLNGGWKRVERSGKLLVLSGSALYLINTDNMQVECLFDQVNHWFACNGQQVLARDWYKVKVVDSTSPARKVVFDDIAMGYVMLPYEILTFEIGLRGRPVEEFQRLEVDFDDNRSEVKKLRSGYKIRVSDQMMLDPSISRECLVTSAGRSVVLPPAFRGLSIYEFLSDEYSIELVSSFLTIDEVLCFRAGLGLFPLK